VAEQHQRKDDAFAALFLNHKCIILVPGMSLEMQLEACAIGMVFA
jgi:hypothetical protein